MRESQFKKPIATLEGFGGVVTSLAFSPDDAWLASGAEDGSVTLWDIASRTASQTFRGHTERVDTVVFSRDGKALLSGARDSLLLVWDLDSGKTLWDNGDFAGRPCSACFVSPTDSLVWLAQDHTLKQCEPRGNKTVNTIRSLPFYDEEISSVAFSPDGRIVASKSVANTIRLWEVSTGTLVRILQILTQGLLDVTSFAFSPDGRTVALGGDDNAVRLCDSNTGKLLRTLSKHSDAVTSVAFNPDGEIIVSGSGDQTVRLWAASTGKLLRTLSKHSDAVTSVAFSPDGEIIVSGSDDQTVRLWAVSTGKLLRTLSGHSKGVTSVALNPDGEIIASGSGDQTVRLWAASTGKLLRTLSKHSDAVTSIAFSPDGEVIASGSDDQTVRLWAASTGKLLRTLSGHSKSVTSVAFSPDGQMIVSGSRDCSLKRWQRDTGDVSPLTKEEGQEIVAIADGPDEQRILAADKSGRLWFCDIAPDGGDRYVCNTDEFDRVHRRISQSSDGRYVLLTFESSGYWSSWERKARAERLANIILVDLTKGQPTRSFVGHKKPVLSAALSPDAKFLASAGEDRSIHVWRVSTGELARVLRAHTGDVNAVIFSHDGRFIASGGADQTIKLWHGVDRGPDDAREPVASASGSGKEATAPEASPTLSTASAEARELQEAMRTQLDSHERRIARLEYLVEKIFRLLDSQSTTPSEDALQIERKRFDDF